MPKLSVIMPVYNAEATLAEAVDSVLSQSLSDLELVCVDDGSTDGSLSILRGYEEKDPRVRVIAQANAGAGAARNRGLETASGEYVHFLDADDRVLPYAYECLCDKAVKYDLDVLRCAAVDWDVGRGCYVEKERNSLSKLQPGDFGRLVGTEEGSPVYKVAVAPWAGVSRRAFLVERGIRFNGLVCVNDRSFFAAEVTNAGRMMVCRDRVVLHRVCSDESSAVHTRHFDCHLCSIEQIVGRMEADGIAPEVQERVLEGEFRDLSRWLILLADGSEEGDAVEARTAEFVEGYDGPYAWRLRAAYRDAVKRLPRRKERGAAAAREVKVEHEACERPKVSVVVPVYNVEDYLNEALDSLVNQTLQDIEFVCVNDGSTDGSLAILEEYAALDKRIRVLDGPNGDYGKAMNRGIDAARGEYLGILEPDGFVPREMYAELYRKARESDADIVKADFYSFWTGPDGREHETAVSIAWSKRFYNRVVRPAREPSVFRFGLDAWNGVYRRKLLERWGIRLDEGAGSVCRGDGFVFRALCRAERVLLVEEPCCRRRRAEPGAPAAGTDELHRLAGAYTSLRRWLGEEQGLWDAFGTMFYWCELDVLLRLYRQVEPGAQRELLHFIHDEFQGPLEEGLVEEGLFVPARMWKLRGIVDDPDAFCDRVRVSVVMPVYNGERYLGEALDGVLYGNALQYEVICVDDGSTDSTPEILAEYAARDPRVRVVTQANAGAGAARNAGMQLARGEYLSFLDADDIFEPGMLELAYDRALAEDSDVIVFRCDEYDEDADEFHATDWSLRPSLLPAGRPFAGEEVPQNFFKAFMGWTWDKLFRTEFVRREGLRFQEQRTTNDLLFTYSALLGAERISILNILLVHRRIHAGSLSVTREKSWRCVYDAFCALRAQMRDWGIFERREQDFVNYALNFSLWHLDTIAGPAYYELYDALKHGWLEDLGVLGRSPDYFYNSVDLEELEHLLSSSPDEYRTWKLDRARTRRDELARQLAGARTELREERGRGRRLEARDEELAAANERLKAQNAELKAEVDERRSDIEELRGSTAWKVGRFITWIPRKIKGAAKRRGS